VALSPSAPVELLGLLPDQLAQALRMGEPEARRVCAHLISGGAPDLEGMARPIARELRLRLAAEAHWSRPQVLERVEDPSDGSLRYLFQLAQGAEVEAVRIPLHKEGRYTVCLSSQVGCAMRCAFCATGRLGLRRHMSAAEIVSTFLTVRDEAPGRVTGAVFMGQGEPFHNYEAVLQAAAVLSHPCGGRIRAEAITISTVGLVPQLLRYAEEGHRYRLFVSLTSAIPERREALLPVAARWSLGELAQALRRLHQSHGDRVTVAWVLMGGVNDGADEVDALQALLGDLPLRVNLIDVNDRRPEGFRRATDEERGRLLDELRRLQVPVVRRYSVGSGEDSACGMLAARRASTR
jgi:23S rRNA (adenine2503-C2)-methyltransferase